MHNSNVPISILTPDVIQGGEISRKRDIKATMTLLLVVLASTFVNTDHTKLVKNINKVNYSVNTLHV